MIFKISGSCTENITNSSTKVKVAPSPTTFSTLKPFKPSSERPPWKTLTEPPLIDIETNDVSSHSEASRSFCSKKFLILAFSVLQFYIFYGS